jgi:hypothetical protein
MKPLRLNVQGDDLVPQETVMAQKKKNLIVISGFSREVDDNCAFLGYYAPSSGNPLPSFRDAFSSWTS